MIISRAWLSPVLAFLLALAPHVASAGSAPVHRRVVVDLSQPPWRAVGRVQTELGARCTGFLLAPRLVVTAAHCLYRRSTGRFVQPSSVHFLWRYAAGAYADHARVVSFVVEPGYDPAAEDRSLGVDRVFLTLDHAVGPAGDMAGLSHVSPRPGVPLLLGGYNRDRAEVAEADPDCRLIGFGVDAGGHRLLLHDCLGLQGTSGAPLFARQPDGHWAVVGLEVAIIGPGGRTGIAEPLDAEAMGTGR
ncbi:MULTISPECIES: serine protease [unclassified Acidisoma]|jgi:protease YdgD|uniref:trypsin-like serine peptidase n=1 Tax=unclassified Acidisoma TaxID=2634065 RepID=UPI00131AE46B|nr:MULTISPECIES: trypsin-like serine protease [unclassified Acidisoma]